jgi:hypothetical protein
VKDNPLQRLGGRKFVLCLLATLLNAMLLVNGYITPLIFRDLMIAVTGGYILGNVGQKALTKETLS